MTLEDGRNPKEEEAELLALLQGVEVSTFFLNGCDLMIFFQQKFKMTAFEGKMKEFSSSNVFEYRREFLSRVLQLEPGQSAIVSNGRVSSCSHVTIM